MSDLEGMINGILSNPDEMKKIMDMAGKIMGTEGGAVDANQNLQSTPTLDSILNGMNDIPGGLGAGLGGLLGGSGINNLLGGAGLGSLLGDGGLGKLLGSSTVLRLLGSPTVKNLISEATSSQNDKRELFNALKPWLSEKRRYKLEKAMVFAKVMRIAGVVALNRGG